MDWGNLASGLLGAIAGAVAGYWAAVRLEEKKASDLTSALESLVLAELCGHEEQLAALLDRILPAWLRRGDDQLWSSKPLLLQLVGPPLGTLYFDQFLRDLAHSHMLVDLGTYYGSVKQFNALPTSVIQRESVGRARLDYAELAFYLFPRCERLIDRLLAQRQGSAAWPEALRERLSRHREINLRGQVIRTVASASESDVRRWHREVLAGKVENVPEQLSRPGSLWWTAYVEESMKL